MRATGSVVVLCLSLAGTVSGQPGTPPASGPWMPQQPFSQLPQAVDAQPSYAQPSYAQPGYAQPAYAQPASGPPFAQPAYAQPAYAQPAYGQPFTQPGYVQPPSGQPGFDPAMLETWQPAPEIVEVPAVLAAERSSVRLDTEVLAPLMDFVNRQSDKQLLVLESQTRNGDRPTLLIGAQFRASAIAARTNSEDRFPYMGRFPSDFVGNTATDIRLLQANQGFVVHAAPGVSGYVETLFSDVFTFPDFKQGSFQVRQAYVTLGDLDQTPFYAFIGKKTVSFGDMGTLSPFSQAITQHYFSPLAEGGGVGYFNGIFNVTATLLNGSRGIRVADSDEKGHLNNFAGNATVTLFAEEQFEMVAGGGYLHGTIYDGSVAEHINPTIQGPRNGAWDAHISARIGVLHLSGEYVSTLEVWPVANHKVAAYHAEAALDLSPFWLSVSWSEGIQGRATDEFEFNQQLVIGTEWQVSPNVKLALEYIRSMGFAPLINLTTVSDKSVHQNTFLAGLTIAI